MILLWTNQSKADKEVYVARMVGRTMSYGRAGANIPEAYLHDEGDLQQAVVRKGVRNGGCSVSGTERELLC